MNASKSWLLRIEGRLLIQWAEALCANDEMDAHWLELAYRQVLHAYHTGYVLLDVSELPAAPWYIRPSVARGEAYAG